MISAAMGEQASTSTNPYEPVTNISEPPPRQHAFTKRILHMDGENDDGHVIRRRRSVSARRKHDMIGDASNTTAKGLGPRPVGGNEKLGMFSGVYVPTCLNVLSILMFLRFGFLLGQAGVYGMIGMLVSAYIVNLLTTFSLSAIASNGTVRGGGAYYLISRSLGPEFGGSIGVVFYLGFVFNTGMNAVGLIDCLKLNFGSETGNWAKVLPESDGYIYLWSTCVLVLCTAICLMGSSIFARASNGLLVILLLATLSIPFSALVVSPFESRKEGIQYTGLSMATFVGNLKPQLTKGAAGSQLATRETFQSLFGILFPATGGIFAGASMSGDLRNPSKSIPKGTLYGLATTFVLYSLVIFAMAATITRASFVGNANVIQETNISGYLILAGEFASAFFSTLMGVIGSAKLLQALARDNLLPGFSLFSQGTKKGDEPTIAIIFTYVVAQICMLLDLNQIASFTTMTYLMTFLVMNLACFLLKIGSAPNFRPSFHFFNWQTAFIGSIISGAAMFFVDGLYASGCVCVLIVIFLIIHYTSPPKSWGDVSQSLIYHQVRKYLLRLRQEHVKFWRPQILLFVNDPRRQYKLIQFCNSMKKGSLYILGHVIVTEDFGGSVPEARRQQAAWTRYIDFSKIKAFVNITISPGVEWGTRQIVMGAGLGGMRPNIAVLGFYNPNSDSKKYLPLIDVTDESGVLTRIEPAKPKIPCRKSKDKKLDEALPTDTCTIEATMKVTSYVTILEDLLLRLQINVAVAKGFQTLEIPSSKGNNTKKYIDLWPIQMSAEIAAGGDAKNVMATNFDTYSLILQLGVILNTVPAWKKVYQLRVAVFVEYESDVGEERGRVKTLLENLRIEAEVLVFWLACGDLPSYEIIVNGSTHQEKEYEDEVENCLRGQDWWDEIQTIRGHRATTASATEDLAGIMATPTHWPEASFQQGPREERVERFMGLRRLLRKSKRKHTMSGLNRLGVSLVMRTQRLIPDITRANQAVEDFSSDSESSSESDEDAVDSAASEGDISDFESDDAPTEVQVSRMRRRSYGDTMRGPPSFKKSTREQQIKVPENINRMTLPDPDLTATQDAKSPVARPGTPAKNSPAALRPCSVKEHERLRPESAKSERPPLSRHASTPKFSSKPVPITRVASEDGPGPSIMFTDTLSPPICTGRLPSAYRANTVFSDHISEEGSPQSRNSSQYFIQSLPISFNDLPCRAQHLILNELMRQQSGDTAVMFTTLPSPVEGTCQSEEASRGYLGDLEVLCKSLPPILLVHSNSMTVTMSL
ncbi:amino acid permease-domain-containing protein [Calycina marina]|uniref:Amino acid permease-domain-containing protein n=1 Tax=Calycina marina TaxID=1763456 RepID=A0A9P7Z5T0_9HELO|nr:amino acid permease-domain-containing protein [Calycina marina]